MSKSHIPTDTSKSTGMKDVSSSTGQSANPLKNGDIVIALDFSPDYTDDNSALTMMASEAEHGMIYANNKMYHSTEGTYQSGVRSHDFNKMVNADNNIGNLAVIRLKQEDVRNVLATVVANWDPKLTKEQIAAQKAKGGMHKLPTPFVNFQERKADTGTQEENKRYELYRAFRAYERNKSGKPLSKSKGVSCGNFVKYSIKASFVELLFPHGIPADVKQQYSAMEAIKSQNQKTDEKRITKLNQIPAAEFEKFEALVKSHIGSDALRNTYFDYLLSPVKSKSLNKFVEEINQFSQILEFAGFLYLKKNTADSKSLPEKCVLDFESYKKLYKQNPEHSIVLTDAEVAQLHSPVKKSTSSIVENLKIPAALAMPTIDPATMGAPPAQKTEKTSEAPSATPTETPKFKS